MRLRLRLYKVMKGNQDLLEQAHAEIHIPGHIVIGVQGSKVICGKHEAQVLAKKWQLRHDRRLPCVTSLNLWAQNGKTKRCNTASTIYFNRCSSSPELRNLLFCMRWAGRGSRGLSTDHRVLPRFHRWQDRATIDPVIEKNSIEFGVIQLEIQNVFVGAISLNPETIRPVENFGHNSYFRS